MLNNVFHHLAVHPTKISQLFALHHQWLLNYSLYYLKKKAE
jgi:hypothetical protein